MLKLSWVTARCRLAEEGGPLQVSRGCSLMSASVGTSSLSKDTTAEHREILTTASTSYSKNTSFEVGHRVTNLHDWKNNGTRL